MLHRRDEGELSSAALYRQHPFLAGRASQHRPHLPHSGAVNRDAVNSDEVVASLNAVRASGDRGFAVVVCDAQDGEAAVAFGAQH
jgi:hypothetical protein